MTNIVVQIFLAASARRIFGGISSFLSKTAKNEVYRVKKISKTHI